MSKILMFSASMNRTIGTFEADINKAGLESSTIETATGPKIVWRTDTLTTCGIDADSLEEHDYVCFI